MMGSDNSKPVFDVSKPNKSAPTATSRPVINLHGPIMKDPMVSDGSDDAPTQEAKPVVKVGEKVIAPLNNPTAAAEESADTAASETADKETEKRESEAAVVDAVAEQTGKKKKGEPNKEDIARQAELEKMIADKKYFVPIGQAKHRRRQWLRVMLLLLILLTAGSYLAVDANLIDLDIDLPYEFIP